MNSAVEDVCKVIDTFSEDEQRSILSHLRKSLVLHPLETAWDVKAETILSAISRSSELVLRGVRGIIAEATFNDVVVPRLPSGWEAQNIDGDQPYDFLLFRREDGVRVRIQVKLQRREMQEPKLFNQTRRRLLVDPPEILYVVEVQRTRTGKRKVNSSGSTSEAVEETRPYRFGEFDILAVNMHPSTRDWRRFMYTVGDWLIPRAEPAHELIQIMQPVSGVKDQYWTDDIEQCIEWFLSSKKQRLYDAKDAKPLKPKAKT